MGRKGQSLQWRMLHRSLEAQYSESSLTEEPKKFNDVCPLSSCLAELKDAGPDPPLQMPVGLRELLQLDSGHLLLLGLCGVKVKFMSLKPERRRPRASPGISRGPPDWESQRIIRP